MAGQTSFRLCGSSPGKDDRLVGLRSVREHHHTQAIDQTEQVSNFHIEWLIPN
jgi:hypothetical protein